MEKNSKDKALVPKRFLKKGLELTRNTSNPFFSNTEHFYIKNNDRNTYTVIGLYDSMILSDVRMFALESQPIRDSHDFLWVLFQSAT